MNILCAYEDHHCIEKAKEYFVDWKENNKEYFLFEIIFFKIIFINNLYSIPANFKVTVYQTAIKFGSEDDWYFLFEKAKITASSAEQVRLFRALASTREYYLLKL